jgi:AraC family transcriptional regulator of adaptative response/methylated-DNA-[protein]-cysteine methyltransferase
MESADQKDFQIKYGFYPSHWGELLIASTDQSICFVWFLEDHTSAINELEKRFPSSSIEQQQMQVHQKVIHFFNSDGASQPHINLHLKGTLFQLKVWRALSEIPFGKLVNYMDIAKSIGQPNASRAVGTAIGKNPIAVLIPCHRVVQTNGQLGGYRWGLERKTAIIKWEMESNRK